jgi:transcriptional regulator with XRE-family HTH domain
VRRSKYNDEFPILAEGYARDGLSDVQIAEKLGIAPSTFYEYQQQHPEFSEALKRGKAPVDRQVENALLKRALGYEFTERQVETDGEGNPIRQKVVRKEVVADVTAQKFWLANRCPEKWRERHHVEAEVTDRTEEAVAEKLIEAMGFEERQEFLRELLGGAS